VERHASAHHHQLGLAAFGVTNDGSWVIGKYAGTR
jgi:hypothetical protein